MRNVNHTASSDRPVNQPTERYAAFISYSHGDEEIGDWLQRRLEQYLVPSSLLGRSTPVGSIHKRLGKVFRDRVELSAAHDLTVEIRKALERSDALIVLCSPRACASQYVNEEIRIFKSFGRGERVFAAIIDGEPHAAFKPGRSPDEECFPQALLARLDDDGRVAAVPEPGEPIAADFRPGKDGRENGSLKLIAGMLGVGLDELVQRERQAERLRRRRTNLIAAGFAALALGAVGAAGLAWHLRNTAETQRRVAVGRFLAITAETLARERSSAATRRESDGDEESERKVASRNVLPAIALEALRRLSPPEASKLAATLAADLAMRPAQLGNDEEIEVTFAAGRRMLATVGFGTGATIIDFDKERVHHVSKEQLGSSGGSAPISTFAKGSPDGKYIVVESHAATNYLIDVDSLNVQLIPAESWSLLFSSNSRHISYKNISYVGNETKTFLRGIELASQNTREVPVERRTDVLHFNGGWVLSSGNGISVVGPSLDRSYFFQGDSSVLSATSNGRLVAVRLGRDLRFPPPPPIAVNGAVSESSVPIAEVEPPNRRTDHVNIKTPGPGTYLLELTTGGIDEVPDAPENGVLTFLSDGETLASIGKHSALVYDSRSGNRRSFARQGALKSCSSVNCTRISSDSNWLVAAEPDGWHVIDYTQGSDWRLPQYRPEYIKIARDKPIALFIGGADIVLVDLLGKKPIYRFARTVSPKQLALSDSGDLLAFGGLEGGRTARLDAGQLERFLCKQPGRNLTAEEWERYLPEDRQEPTCATWK